jgi:hypothetical protein
MGPARQAVNFTLSPMWDGLRLELTDTGRPAAAAAGLALRIVAVPPDRARTTTKVNSCLILIVGLPSRCDHAVVARPRVTTLVVPSTINPVPHRRISEIMYADAIVTSSPHPSQFTSSATRSAMSARPHGVDDGRLTRRANAPRCR